MCHGVAVRPVHDPRSDRQNTQIPGDQSVGPRRITARAPAFVPELEPRRSITSQRRRVKICGEIPRAVTFVYRVYVLFEQAPRLNCVGGGRY